VPTASLEARAVAFVWKVNAGSLSGQLGRTASLARGGSHYFLSYLNVSLILNVGWPLISIDVTTTSRVPSIDTN